MCGKFRALEFNFWDNKLKYQYNWNTISSFHQSVGLSVKVLSWKIFNFNVASVIIQRKSSISIFIKYTGKILDYLNVENVARN